MIISMETERVFDKTPYSFMIKKKKLSTKWVWKEHIAIQQRPYMICPQITT